MKIDVVDVVGVDGADADGGIACCDIGAVCDDGADADGGSASGDIRAVGDGADADGGSASGDIHASGDDRADAEGESDTIGVLITKSFAVIGVSGAAGGICLLGFGLLILVWMVWMVWMLWMIRQLLIVVLGWMMFVMILI